MMKRPIRAKLNALAMVAALSVVTPVALHAAQHDDTARLSNSTDTFQSNFRRGDYLSMMESLPQRLIDAVARQTGQDRGLAMLGLADQTQNAMEGIEVILIEMDVEAATIRSNDGLTFALIPTVTVLQSPAGQRVRTTSTTLGLREDGVWTLSRVASLQQETAMKTLYPEVADVTFPGMTQKVVN